MRPARPSLIVLVTFAALAYPALAKNAKTQKQGEETAPTNCHAYQQAPDGNWVPLPCDEDGATKSTHHRAAPKHDAAH